MSQSNKYRSAIRQITVAAALATLFAGTSNAEAIRNHHGLAEGEYKFMGNISSESNKCNCTSTSYLDKIWDYENPLNQYWNQITPENSGKWGSVEQKLLC
jgi:GH35 family endo-1,4-beta-xylanase